MAESPVIVPRDELLRRIRSEYLEMPGLRLTHAQARRLWGLDEQTCAQLLTALMDDKFLCRRSDGAYIRLTEGALAFPRWWTGARTTSVTTR